MRFTTTTLMILLTPLMLVVIGLIFVYIKLEDLYRWVWEE
jgi:hypothetical protein